MYNNLIRNILPSSAHVYYVKFCIFERIILLHMYWRSTPFKEPVKMEEFLTTAGVKGLMKVSLYMLHALLYGSRISIMIQIDNL